MHIDVSHYWNNKNGSPQSPIYQEIMEQQSSVHIIIISNHLPISTALSTALVWIYTIKEIEQIPQKQNYPRLINNEYSKIIHWKWFFYFTQRTQIKAVAGITILKRDNLQQISTSIYRHLYKLTKHQNKNVKKKYHNHHKLNSFDELEQIERVLKPPFFLFFYSNRMNICILQQIQYLIHLMLTSNN